MEQPVSGEPKQITQDKDVDDYRRRTELEKQLELAREEISKLKTRINTLEQAGA